MYSTIILALAIGAPAPKPPSPPPGLVGEWVAESVTVGGRLNPTGLEVRWVFTADGKRVVIHGTEKVATGHYTANLKAEPAALDLLPPRGSDETYPCVFKVEKDKLTLIVNRPEDGRPAGFESREGSTSTLYVFKGARPQE